MALNRRAVLGLAVGTAAGLGGRSFANAAETASSDVDGREPAANHAACLVDTTLCVGCRKCEEACNRANNLPQPEAPFDDRDVLRQERRPDAGAFTVLNEYTGNPSKVQPERPNTTVKVQCMHCLEPACASACIVGAITKAADGSVVYDPEICIGCRYCMVACPFALPAYEYHRLAAPRVRKCELCYGRDGAQGANPACAAACPMEAVVFGTRAELLELARSRIAGRPERYLDRIYGEHEVGGTSWLYLVGRPVEEVGLLSLPDEAPPRRTESIQHGIFNYGALPIAMYGTLGGLMWLSHRREHLAAKDETDSRTGGES